MAHPTAERATPSRLMRTLARLTAAHPAWVAAHAQAYAQLAQEQAQASFAAWQRRLVKHMLAGACGVLGLGLAGVATMLWAVLDPPIAARLWVLGAIPLLPLAVAGALWRSAQQVGPPMGLEVLKQQWAADLALLREATPT